MSKIKALLLSVFLILGGVASTQVLDPQLGALRVFTIPQGGTGTSTSPAIDEILIGDGTGQYALQTFASAGSDVYVPYTGATGDLNLGANGIGGGAALFSTLSVNDLYVQNSTIASILTGMTLDSSGYDIDSLGNNFTWGASAGADNMVFDNQYLTLKSSASGNGLYVQNDAASGDPFIAFKLGSTVFGSMGIRDSDSDALYITAGGTFSSKNIKLTTSNSEFFRMLLMNKAAIVEAQGSLPTGATPSAAGGNVFLTANTGAINITDFTGGTTGQTIKIIGNDGGNTTVTDTASIFLAGSANFALGDRDTLVLYYDGTRWQEFSRSNN